MSALLKSIPHIRLRTLRIVRGSSQGNNYTKNTSNTGFEFDALRAYEQGDDVRRIDWNSSVRTGTLMVRAFREQRNRSLLIMLDVSPSTYTGSSTELKCHVMQVVVNSISMAVQSERDTLGICLTYNDTVLEYVPLRSGKAHSAYCISVINRAIEKLAQHHQHAVSLPCVLNNKNIIAALTRHTWIILITDGLVKNYTTWWQQLRTRHTLTIVRVRDRYEATIPQFCIVQCYDPENQTHAPYVINSHDLQQQAQNWYVQQSNYARLLGIPLLDLLAGNPYESNVRLFFEQGGK